jgi:F-box/leucine-rich repeat protein 10/11
MPDGPSSSGIKEEPAPKSRAAPRGSGLGPKRVACDACRKRRIRCHHKDEHNDGISSKQTAVTAFGPSNHSLAHDAASALNSLAAIASEAGFQDNGSGRNPDRFEVAAKFNSAILGTPRAPVNGLGLNDASPEGANTGKKGRSKACDDCRKSKVRFLSLFLSSSFSLSLSIQF